MSRLILFFAYVTEDSVSSVSKYETCPPLIGHPKDKHCEARFVFFLSELTVLFVLPWKWP